MKDLTFGKTEINIYKTNKFCPHCKSTLLEKDGLRSIQNNSVERRIECISCGVVFYAKYKFDTIEFDGWKYGMELFDGIRKDNTGSKSGSTPKRKRSNGNIDSGVDENKSNRMGSKKSTTKLSNGNGKTKSKKKATRQTKTKKIPKKGAR